MNVWWSAIDRKYSSYEEIKNRKVIAQGWRDLGNLSPLARFAKKNMQTEFIQVVQLLGDASEYDQIWWHNNDRNEQRAPMTMWRLLNVCKGDLVVALEGTQVRGICEANANGFDSYQHQDAWEYAQTINFPIKWIDWEDRYQAFLPSSPSQGVLGLRGLRSDREKVIAAWHQMNS